MGPKFTFCKKHRLVFLAIIGGFLRKHRGRGEFEDDVLRKGELLIQDVPRQEGGGSKMRGRHLFMTPKLPLLLFSFSLCFFIFRLDSVRPAKKNATDEDINHTLKNTLRNAKARSTSERKRKDMDEVVAANV